jgi:ABC-type molybdate transport system ATPase subunit
MAARHTTGTLRLDVTLRTTAPVIALQGPSGSGKSTLLRILAGVTRARDAVVKVGGVEWQGPSVFLPPWARRVGWVPQDALLFPHLSVLDNLRFGSSRSVDACRHLADQLGLGAMLARRPRHLSGGERQRVAIGRALLASPCLLLLDEPFAALDAPLRVVTRRVIQEYAAQLGATILLVTHQASDADGWATAHRHMVDGRLEP